MASTYGWRILSQSRWTTTSSAALAAVVVTERLWSLQQPETSPTAQRSNRHWVLCEAAATTQATSATVASAPATTTTTQIRTAPAAWRRQLAQWKVWSLRTPRRLTLDDPDLQLAPSARKQRQRDEATLRDLQQQAAPTDEQATAALAQRMMEVLYGPGTTVADRQVFLETFGCTGWTSEALQVILEQAQSRGVVEIGAGNGQWARALTDAYREAQLTAQAKVPGFEKRALTEYWDMSSQSSSSSRGRPKRQPFDFCLAYDDFSQVPLHPAVYHARTRAHRRHFGRVDYCDADLSVLRQFATRGRVLLLVFPPPTNVAARALQTYQEASPATHDTCIYVGEGRGGANAQEDFFAYLVEHDWVLERMVPVQPFGTKGYEKLFVFKRRPRST